MSRFLVSTMALSLVCLVGCAATSEQENAKKYQLPESKLKNKKTVKIENDVPIGKSQTFSEHEFKKLRTLSVESEFEESNKNVNYTFRSAAPVTIAANDMPLLDFIHYAFGEVLGVNYILSEDLKSDQQRLTLNIQQPTSKPELMEQLTALLAQRQVSIESNGEVMFLSKPALSKAKATIGVGRDSASVPSTQGQILQVIPIKYGIKVSIERTIRDLVDASITTDFDQNAFFVLGNRANVLRAIELVKLLDVPANRGKFIGMLSLKYMNINEFIKQVPLLMSNEGLLVGINTDINKSVLLVPLTHIGAVAVFATSDELLERVRYWAEILDKPNVGEAVQYFVYNPVYARASDLGDSISGLLRIGGNSAPNNSNSSGPAANQLASNDSNASQTVSGRDVSFVVDERSNALIFSTTATRYQTILPLLDKLDVLPKQIMLEILVAEVTLSGNFRFGVEYALNNSSRFSFSNLNDGEGGVRSFGGLAALFQTSSAEIRAAFSEDDEFINRLSNPTLLVRDGVTANISVGNEIPILGSTTTDGINGRTQNVQYRQTGIEVRVTPTVNAQGVVIMNIEQNISDEVESSGGIASPTILRRELNTEVVVDSGTTVLLGGLILDNKSNSNVRVPGAGNIPILGNLFKRQSKASSKTELVLLVTPKVIERNDEWDKILKDFQTGLDNIEILE